MKRAQPGGPVHPAHPLDSASSYRHRRLIDRRRIGRGLVLDGLSEVGLDSDDDHGEFEALDCVLDVEPVDESSQVDAEDNELRLSPDVSSVPEELVILFQSFDANPSEQTAAELMEAGRSSGQVELCFDHIEPMAAATGQQVCCSGWRTGHSHYWMTVSVG